MTCRLSSAVLVGSGYLAEYARKRNENVFVVPTSIELEKHPVQPELAQDDPFVVCWTGSTSTLAHFGTRAGRSSGWWRSGRPS